MFNQLPSGETWRIAPATSLICALAVVIFLMDSIDPGIGLKWRNWGYMAPEMFASDWWRWITPSFFHLGGMHLVLNLFWMWSLGVMIELCWGSGVLLFIYVVSAIAGTAGEVLIHQSGVGMSGVVYGLAAFAWIISRRDTRFGVLLPPGHARFFVGWLVIGIILSELNIFPIGNAAHAGGGLAGLVIGGLISFKRFAKKVPQPVPVPVVEEPADS